jgi:hypothetical protein
MRFRHFQPNLHDQCAAGDANLRRRNSARVIACAAIRGLFARQWRKLEAGDALPIVAKTDHAHNLSAFAAIDIEG